MDGFYIVKVVSENYNAKQLKNYSMKIHNVLYVLTVNKSNQCILTWANHKVAIEIINDNYLFIYTRDYSQIKAVESVWKRLFLDKSLCLEKTLLSSNEKIDTRISKDLLDFTFKDEGLHLELLFSENNIDVLYRNDGMVRCTVSENPLVGEKIKEITRLLLEK